MQLQLQELVETVVQQHEADFAALHADLQTAVPEVASRWADRFPRAAMVHGMIRCGDVRQTLFCLFDARGKAPFPTLTAREGPACSVVLSDGSGTEMRVRRWPNNHLRERVRVVTVAPPGKSQEAAQAAEAQQVLDEGLAEPVFPQPTAGSFDLYVLWWADSDEACLQGAQLAAVVDIDSPSVVQILAAAPLPPPPKSALTGHSVQRSLQDRPLARPRDDFDEHDDPSEAGGPAPPS